MTSVMLHAFLQNWKERHQTPTNLVLHALGIPLTLIALIPLLKGKFVMASLFFATGYVLQFLGHAQEKSEVGELLWMKRLFKKVHRKIPRAD